MEDSIQRKIYNEIKRRDKVSMEVIADKLGVNKSSVSSRLEGSVRFDGLWEILQACGYSINIYKTPEGRENKITVGDISCEECAYRSALLEMESKVKYILAECDRDKEVPIE